MNQTDAPIDAEKTARLRVWDLPTRLFHWGLLAAVAAALTTGWAAPKWWIDYHAWAGYAVLGLIAFRVVWAFFGSEYSKIASFAFGPATILHHLRGLFSRRPETFIGHNPAGAAMIFALAAVLIAIVATGLIQLGGIEKQGPLASAASFAQGRSAHGLHEVLANVLLALIGAHVAGVIWESHRSRENLAAAMVTGDKTVSAGAARRPRHPANVKAALVATALTALAGAAGVAGLAAIPAKGLTAVLPNAAFEKNCADCHQLYHPSLLPADEWRALMASLPDHFGEDASLPAATAAQITEHLVRHAAEHWDTKAAYRFRAPQSLEAGEITATQGWKRAHRHLKDAQFSSSKVKSRSNCQACHGDAALGRFAKNKIRLPEGAER